MGNNCFGPNLDAVSASLNDQPPEGRLPPPDGDGDDKNKSADNAGADSSKESDASKTVQDTPPEPVTIPGDVNKPPEPDQPVKPKEVNEPASNAADAEDAEKPKPDKPEVVNEPVKPEVVSEPVKQEVVNQPASSTTNAGEAKQPAQSHVKRVSSVGLRIESVLGRKTENLKDLYSLGRKLGQGQFGTTYLCVEKATGKEYACKSIAKRKLTTQEDVDDVRREIQIMHHLAGHPNVIQIVGAYEDAVAVHVVMELCSGGELFDRIIQRGHYTEKKAAELARVIVRVVESCHSMGVMHRDLKPENFLFISQEEEAPLKTIDFGLSIFFRPGISISSLSLMIIIHDLFLCFPWIWKWICCFVELSYKFVFSIIFNYLL